MDTKPNDDTGIHVGIVGFEPTFRLYVQSDDGVRVWLDGALVMDYWRPMNSEQHHLNWTYLDGFHTLRVEYKEHAGNARIRFWWEKHKTSGDPIGGVTCPGGSLRLDAWSVEKTCTAVGWTATIFVKGHGGDCSYTYAWEREVQGRPTGGSMTFTVESAGDGAIVGEATVTSGDQTAVVGLHIPSDCR